MGEFQPLLSPPPIATDEWNHVLWIGLPLVLLQILEYVSIPVINMYIGHLPLAAAESRVVLSAGGLSSLFLTTTAYSVVIGVSTAMDALCAQAYGRVRAGEIGIVLQTALACAAVLCIPLAILMYFSSGVLRAMGQPEEIALATEQLLRWLILEVPVLFVYEFFKRVLQGQNIVWPIVGSISLGVVVDLTVAYFLMFHTSLGFVGGMLGMVCYYSTAASVMFTRIPIKAMHFDWKIAVARLPEFLFLSSNGCIMFLSELGGIAATSFMAGSLPHASTALSANTIYSGFRSLTGMVFLGVGVASSVRVGNALGGNLPVRARTAAWLTIQLGSAWGLFTTIVSIWLGPMYATLYTQDPAVLEQAKTLFYVTAPFQVTLGVWAAVQGTFRGSGKPHQGAIANVIAFIIIGLPLAHALAQVYGIVGLWLGISIGFCICAAYGLYWTIHADWENMAEAVSQKE
ncbi:hypothetical protein AC1031_005582 [Aphanomyces cochlioides]|nr:hypothetical protein AC1031_005582 [Aphanomyces cochlioides]